VLLDFDLPLEHIDPLRALTSVIIFNVGRLASSDIALAGDRIEPLLAVS
jgi:hypothetical protein